MATPRTYTVKGIIRDNSQNPVPGLTVYAFDQDPNTPDNPLGKPSLTNKLGQYVITYTDSDFRLGGKESGGADIVLQVYSGNKLVAETERKSNCKQDETIDAMGRIPDLWPFLWMFFSNQVLTQLFFIIYFQ